MYVFHIRRPDQAPASLEIADLPDDQAIFAKACGFLAEHRSCDHVEVWEGERPVVALHRHQPILRPIKHATRPGEAGAQGG